MGKQKKDDEKYFNIRPRYRYMTISPRKHRPLVNDSSLENHVENVGESQSGKYARGGLWEKKIKTPHF